MIHGKEEGLNSKLAKLTDKYYFYLFLYFCFVFCSFSLSSGSPLLAQKLKNTFVIGVDPELNRFFTELFSFVRYRIHQ